MTAQIKDIGEVAKDVEQMQQLCSNLMQSKHYQKIGPEGVFAIVQKAKSLSMDPLDALNGSLYYVQGKVEMTSQAMNQLIRQAGHSISKDAKSNDTICILHGRRADTGDTWTESFSMEEAKRAGIFRQGGPWTKYPRDMLFARALSRLARQLFPDVIKGCYVQGEIVSTYPGNIEDDEIEEISEELISKEQASLLEELLNGHEEIEEKVLDFVKRQGGEGLSDIKASDFDKIKARVNKLILEKEAEFEEQEGEYAAVEA